MRGVFGDPKARVITLVRRSKKIDGNCGACHSLYDRTGGRVRDLSAGDHRVVETSFAELSDGGRVVLLNGPAVVCGSLGWTPALQTRTEHVLSEEPTP